jgi:hypothetical protein
MRIPWLTFASLAAWLFAPPAMAQFGQNPLNQNKPQAPAGARLLPRSGGGYLGNYQNSPFNSANNGFGFNNNGFGFNGSNPGFGFNNNGGGFNGFNNGMGFNGYNNSFGNPWAGNFPGGQPNPWGLGGANPAWNYGNIWGPAPPFGGYQFSGYGNYAPIVGVSNGWWPYEPAYNYNHPVNQYLTNLFLQGLPKLDTFPGNQVQPRVP